MAGKTVNATKLNVFETSSFNGGIAPFESKGPSGSFKMGYNLDPRKRVDSISSGQDLTDIGNLFSTSASISPSASRSPSSSPSPSYSASQSPSSSPSPSGQGTSSPSPSSSLSPSASTSPSSSVSPSSSPSPSPALGNSVFSDLIRFFVNASDGNVYGFGNTGKVYKITPELACYQVFDIGQEIKGAYEKPSSSGNTYLVFATNTNLHHKLIPGLSNWQDVDKTLPDWPKTNLSSQDWHTMTQVGGDVLIADGSRLAFVGYDDSYTNEALDLIPGNIVKTLLERVGFAIIGTYRAAAPNEGINAAIDSEVPLAQVGTKGMIVYSNLTDTVPVRQIPGGGQANPGGVANEVTQANFFQWQQTALSWINKQVIGNMALFGIYNNTEGKGGIYSYGRRDKDYPFILNLEYSLNVNEIGALTNIWGLTFASYRDGVTFGVKVTDVNNKAVGRYDAPDFKAPVKKISSHTTWGLVQLFMSPIVSGQSVEYWYRFNKTGSFIQAKTTDGQTAFSTVGGNLAMFSIQGLGEIYEHYIVLNPIGNVSPEVYRDRVYFL